MRSSANADAPSDESLQLARRQLDLLARSGVWAHVIESAKWAVDVELARRQARPMLRWLGEDRFEVGPAGDTTVLRIPRAGAESFALALTHGAEHANAVAELFDLVERSRAQGSRVVHQRLQLARWLEAAGHHRVASAVRRVRVRARDGAFLSP